ncbi:MAG: single-stranded-DNA-specific exonuclease RecJ [Deltaproteobacteria bacterium]|nr:single-stranded-DNA-specific exonuclease RecJ [Deltaproteobacteria bacterium]
MTAQEPAADASAQTTAQQFASPDALHACLRGHPVISRILWSRGYRTREELDALFNPELSRLPDPLRLLDMKRAVERVADAILGSEKNSVEKITIYGDYDVDGTCGSALLLDFFGRLGVEAGSYQPDRFTEGYGVNTEAVGRLIAEGTKVLITVDCGITAVESARFARVHGTDMIVLDHHKLGAELPSAFAVVDPQRPEDASGLQNLCGTGIAFFFCVALRAELRARGFFTDERGGQKRPEPNLKSLLDLVAVATVADMVDVRGVNRILLTHGMQVLAKSPRPGLRAILEAAGVEKPTATHCGFVIGPRINAAGRLKHARAALALLTSDNVEEARVLAQELEVVNTERRATQAAVTEEALQQAREQIESPIWKKIAENLRSAGADAPAVPWPRALVLHSEHWHEGVVGIVASKVVEEFGRPVFILAAKAKEEASAGKEKPDQPTLKGSVRSVPKIDILAAISEESVARHLLGFGGHAHAGGVTLSKDKVDDFLVAINLHLAATTGAEHFARERRFDAEVALHEIDARLVQELDRLGPFGQKFPEPTLKLSGAGVADVRVMKEKHLKLKLQGKGLSTPEAVWFNALAASTASAQQQPATDDAKNSAAPATDTLPARLKTVPHAFWISPQWNEWQGSRRLQLRVSHAEPA